MLCAPKVPVSEICGKNAALATPTLALAATRILFGPANVGTALAAEPKASPVGTSGRCGCSADGQAASDGSGIPTQQDADVVLRLLDELLRLDNLGFGLLQQRLRLIDVGDGTFAAFELDLVELQDLVVGLDGLLGELKLVVELAQQEVVGCDRADQRDAARLPGRIALPATWREPTRWRGGTVPRSRQCSSARARECRRSATCRWFDL